MNTQIREWWLFSVMSLLIVLLVAIAWWDVPSLSPAAVTYSTPTETAAVANDVPALLSERPISLNTATKEELTRLDGLGEKTAEKILAYRDSHGGFDSVEELLNVEGVGEKKLAAWKPYLTV